MRFLAVASLFLASCAPRAPVAAPAPVSAPPPASSATAAPSTTAAEAGSAPAPAGSAPAPAGSAPAAEKPLPDAPDAYAWHDYTEVRRTPEAFCAMFLRDVRDARAYGQPTPAPTCRIVRPPAAWRPGGAFLDARAMSTSYVRREAVQLLVKTAAGWHDTPIEWGVLEIDAATPAWSANEPDRFEIEGSRLLAYAAGEDVWWNEGTQPDGSRNPDDRFLRGAYGCEFGPRALTCFRWNPAEVTPLGRKSAPDGFRDWASLPWHDRRDLDFGAGWPKRPFPTSAGGSEHPVKQPLKPAPRRRRALARAC